MLAVDEACQNVIRHAYGGDPSQEIYVDVRRVADRIVFDVCVYRDGAGLLDSLRTLRTGRLDPGFVAEPVVMEIDLAAGTCSERVIDGDQQDVGPVLVRCHSGFSRCKDRAMASFQNSPGLIGEPAVMPPSRV